MRREKTRGLRYLLAVPKAGIINLYAYHSYAYNISNSPNCDWIGIPIGGCRYTFLLHSHTHTHTYACLCVRASYPGQVCYSNLPHRVRFWSRPRYVSVCRPPRVVELGSLFVLSHTIHRIAFVSFSLVIFLGRA
jgi:hypothetical protein